MNRRDIDKLQIGDFVKVKLWMKARQDGRSRRRRLPNANAEFFGQVLQVTANGRVLVKSDKFASWQPYSAIERL